MQDEVKVQTVPLSTIAVPGAAGSPYERMRAEFAIWWLSPEDLRAIDEELEWPQAPPVYLLREIEDLRGRAGRGRLWFATELRAGRNPWDDPKVDPWPDTPLSRRLQDCGGIVIRALDVALLRTMPGVVTDLKLDRLL